MSYVELTGTNKQTAQALLDQVLKREDTVTMIVTGLDHEGIASNAKFVMSQHPSTWWVIWVQNPLLLTDEQLTRFQQDPANPDKPMVVCVLSRSDHPAAFLSAEEAQSKSSLLAAFAVAEAQ